MFISLRGFLIMVFVIFLSTIALVFGDVIQSGNYAEGMTITKIIFFLVMMMVCAFIIWRFKES